jgi:hypothetical protein
MSASARQRWRSIHVGLLLVPAAAVALVLWEGRHAREDPAELLRALRSEASPRLPTIEGSGARSATGPERYERDRLYELVDGAAEPYLERGFVRCVAAIYTFADGGGLEIAAESHRFRDEAGARAQAAAERPSAALPVEGAPGVFTDGQVLLAVAGRDLLKLTALSSQPGARDRLLSLAAAWRKERP